MPDARLDDLTELRRARETIARMEATIDELNVRLLDAERGKTNFVSRVMNELTNPLGAMIGLSEQLLAADSSRPAPWTDVREVLRMVRDESVALQFQLRNVLMAGELESGRAKAQPCRADLGAVFDDVIGTLQPAAVAKGLAITRHGVAAPPAADSLACTGCLDASMLGLVVANLLDNAIKWSPPGGRIAVSCEVDEAALRLVVADEGPGLHGREKQRAFDGFWQADESMTRASRGLGLGLAVACGCAELMGGRLTLADDTPRGALLGLAVPWQDQGDGFFADGANVFRFSEEADMVDVLDGVDVDDSADAVEVADAAEVAADEDDEIDVVFVRAEVL
jgi:signal transduction histidine kinase